MQIDDTVENTPNSIDKAVNGEREEELGQQDGQTEQPEQPEAAPTL